MSTERLPSYFTSWVRIKSRQITNPLAVAANFVLLFYSWLVVVGICRRKRIDIVLSTTTPSHFYCSLAARTVGCLSVWHLQQIVVPSQGHGFFSGLLNYFARRFSHLVLCPSKAVKSSVPQVSDKASVIYYPYRDLPATFRPRREYLREYGLEKLDDKIIVGMACRLVLWKGIQVVIRAAPEIIEKYPETRFLILGDSEYNTQKNVLRSLIAQLGLQDTFILYGFVPRPLELVSCFDICVHASISPEPMATTVIDYMLMGKPIVASSGGGIDEVVINGETGIIVAPDSASAMARGLAGLLNQKNRWPGLGEKARAMAKRVFDPDRFYQALERELSALVERNPRKGTTGGRR